MDIFDFAMQMETDGEKIYRDMAEKTVNTGLRTILLMLADEEVKHYQILKKNKEKSSELTQSDLLNNAKNVFAEMKENAGSPDLSSGTSGQSSLYQKALQIEIKSRNFYRDKADETDHPYQKQLFLVLAAEEDKHVFLIENILDFIARPAAWLENAEFTHLEDY